MKVLDNLRSSQGPQMSDYVIIPDEDYSDEDEEIILVPYGKIRLQCFWMLINELAIT